MHRGILVLIIILCVVEPQIRNLNKGRPLNKRHFAES